jgi:hypothetical protein
VESSGKVLDIEEIIVYTPFLDESTLRVGDKLIHERRKPKSKHFGNDLGNGMD